MVVQSLTVDQLTLVVKLHQTQFDSSRKDGKFQEDQVVAHVFRQMVLRER